MVKRFYLLILIIVLILIATYFFLDSEEYNEKLTSHTDNETISKDNSELIQKTPILNAVKNNEKEISPKVLGNIPLNGTKVDIEDEDEPSISFKQVINLLKPILSENELLLVNSEPELIYSVNFHSNCDKSFININNYYSEPIDTYISSKTYFFDKSDLDKYDAENDFDIGTAGIVEKIEIKDSDEIKEELERYIGSVDYVGAIASCLHSNHIYRSVLLYKFIKNNEPIYISPYTNEEVKINEIEPFPEEKPPEILSKNKIDMISNILISSSDELDIHHAIQDLLGSIIPDHEKDNINYFVEHSYERNTNSDLVRSAVCEYLEYKKIERYYCNY